MIYLLLIFFECIMSPCTHRILIQTPKFPLIVSPEPVASPNVAWDLNVRQRVDQVILAQFSQVQASVHNTF